MLLTDACDQVDPRPAVLADELAGRRGRLAEGAGDLVGEADGPGERDRHIAVRTGEGARPEPARPVTAMPRASSASVSARAAAAAEALTPANWSPATESADSGRDSIPR